MTECTLDLVQERERSGVKDRDSVPHNPVPLDTDTLRSTSDSWVGPRPTRRTTRDRNTRGTNVEVPCAPPHPPPGRRPRRVLGLPTCYRPVVGRRRRFQQKNASRRPSRRSLRRDGPPLSVQSPRLSCLQSWRVMLSRSAPPALTLGLPPDRLTVTGRRRPPPSVSGGLTSSGLDLWGCLQSSSHSLDPGVGSGRVRVRVSGGRVEGRRVYP